MYLKLNVTTSAAKVMWRQCEMREMWACGIVRAVMIGEDPKSSEINILALELFFF